MSIVVNKTRLPVTEWQTVSGSVVSVNDARMRNAKSLSVALEPIQDLHGYDAPWVGGAGANLFDIEKATIGSGAYGLSISRSGDTIRIYGTCSASGTATRFFAILSYADYSLSGKSYVVQALDVVGGTFTSVYGFRTATEKSVAVGMKLTENQQYDVTFKISVSATSQTAWSPYENLCPISGRSSVTAVRDGKNLLGFSAFSDLSNWRTDIATSGRAPTTNANKGFILPVKEGSTYTLNLDISTEYPTYLYLCASVNGVSTVRHYITTNTPSLSNIPKTFTVQSGEVWYIRMGSTIDERNFSPQIAKTHSLQLELGSATTAYEPYQGTSVTLSLGQTVYGGSVDLVSGVMTATKKSVTFIGDNSYSWYIYDPDNYDSFCFVVDLPDKSKKKLTSICDKYKNVDASWGAGGDGKYCVFSDHTTLARLYFRPPYSGFGETVADWKTWLSNNPLQVCYELATPQTIQLTAHQIEMLMRNNTVWSDAGQVTLEYAKIRS